MMRNSYFRPALETLENREVPGSILRPGLGLLDASLLEALGAGGRVPWGVSPGDPADAAGGAASRPSPAGPSAQEHEDAPHFLVSAGASAEGAPARADSGALPSARQDTSDPWQSDLLFTGLESPTRPASAHLPAPLAAPKDAPADSGAAAAAGAAGAPLTPAPGALPTSAAPVAGNAASAGPTPSAAGIALGLSQAPAAAAAPPPLGALVPAGITDPYTLYTSGDGYTGAPGQDRQSFLSRYQPFDPALAAASTSPPATRTGPADPGSTGPFTVMTQEYNLGNLAFRPTDAPWASSGTELTGEIKAPTDLGTTAHPVVVLLHGRHVTSYDPTSGGAFLEWPPTGTHVPVPSYRGYDYLGDVLASNGYVVVSIGADGINARDAGAGDAGALARAQVLQRTYLLLSDLNQDGMLRPHTLPPAAGTDLFTTTTSPFGTRFVGAINLQDIGIMGHSRGGEGVARNYLFNQTQTPSYGIKAVFALAPIDFVNELSNNVPFEVLLPYNDGDVSDLQGAHFFDDSRYNVGGDTGPKYSLEVMGANHNFYNTVWSPGLFPTIGSPPGFGGTSDEGRPAPPTRLTEAQQQGTGLAYMAGFFRTYLGNESQFQPILSGDAPPPPSSQVTANEIHTSYLPPDNSALRRDVNRLTAAADLTTNRLGGAVVTGGLNTYSIVAGPGSFAAPNRGPQLGLGYTSTLGAFYENDLPAGARDERPFATVEFRAAVTVDARNPAGAAQDFSVVLADGASHTASIRVSAVSNNLFYPPGGAHEVLNSVRVPLNRFTGVDLSDVRYVRLNFDQHNSGAFRLADVAFADSNSVSAPVILSAVPNSNQPGQTTSVRVTFNQTMDPTTVTTGVLDSSTGPDYGHYFTNVVAVGGTGNTQFDFQFDALTAAGAYTFVIGPYPANPAGVALENPYTISLSVAGLSVTSSTPAGVAAPGLDHVRFTFNRALDPAYVSPYVLDVFAGPDGDHYATNAVLVGGNNLDLYFDPLTVTGTYTLSVGPYLADLFGNVNAPYSTTFIVSNELVVNGGFETGDFSGWTQSGDTGATGVGSASTLPNPGTPHGGTYAAYFGPVGGLGYVTQTLATTTGSAYTLSFWLSHPYASTGNEWLVRVGATTLADVHDAGNFNYTRFQYTFTAASSSTPLQFGFVEPPAYFFLDDVSVS